MRYQQDLTIEAGGNGRASEKEAHDSQQPDKDPTRWAWVRTLDSSFIFSPCAF
jgi:hypothetical protein